MNLSSIGDKYGTQKNTHVSFGKTILDIYEPYFEPLKDKPLNIVEIGVLSGASLFTWQEYFTQAMIFGLEINPPPIETDRIKVFKCDQGDIIDLATCKDRIPGKLDIVIDDGSHINDYTLLAFHYLFDHLNSGGLYIIEDTLCTYDTASKDWPGMVLNSPIANFYNQRIDVDRFILKHIQEMDFSQSQIFYVHFYRNLIIIKKA